MTEHWLEKHTETNDLTKDLDINDEHNHGVRIYRSSPGSITLQLRSYGSVAWPNKGKPKRMITTVRLLKEDVETVIAALQIELADLQ